MTENDLPEKSDTRAASQLVRFGPAVLVTAAFIGPGTVTTASIAGAEHGLGLLWTVLFASIGAIVLQSLAARVGIITKQGLAETIFDSLSNTPWIKPASLMVIAALGIGNAAYQAGNLSGAVAGLSALTNASSSSLLVLITFAAGLVLCLGNLKWLSNSLIVLVLLLSFSFSCTAIVTFPDPARLLNGLFSPSISSDQLTTVLAMIGTTIVPYNLFLHASSAAGTWRTTQVSQAIKNSNIETVLAISVGGIITASILITASAAFHDRGIALESTQDLPLQLRPTLGSFSTIAFAVGLFAAGFTSALTAPLATAYAVTGCFGWTSEPKNKIFKFISLSILVIGAITALVFGKTPKLVIHFAQTANAILLPAVAIFLLYIANFQIPVNQRSRLPIRVTAGLVVAGVSLLALWKLQKLITGIL
ncbi:MAG: Nramp family divalent metal transporter [Rubripirellula sp.]|nr:Nramp family divalent metal transporter [Rubripirellula sp.]